MTNSDVYRADPAVRIESSKNIINKFNISFNYLYQRLHQQKILYSFIADATVCDVLVDGFTMPTQTMIQSAAKAAGWHVDRMSFTNLWPSGYYICSGTSIGWVNSSAQFTTVSDSGIDASGNSLRTTSIENIRSADDTMCRGANWRARKRFSQNVTENYTVTVNSPQSQTLYGTKERTLSLSLQSDFNPEEWEDPAKINASFSGTQTAAAGDSDTYYINKDTNANELNIAMLAIINKAKTEILASHRDSEISFSKFLWPEIKLRHTVRLNTNRIDEKGKVKEIKHIMNSNGDCRTEVTLIFYRSVGSTTPTTITAPTRPVDVAPAALSPVTLDSRWGEDPNQPFAVNWDGYVGNRWKTENIGGFSFGGPATNRFYTNYTESFIVDTPAISDSVRNQRELTVSASYDINIPNDSLSITFIDSEAK